MAGKVLIPENTEWFIGELVEEFKAADRTGNLVHINMILIKADSPDVAYHKAIALGEWANRVFTNTTGVDITVRFRGLRGLYAVYYRLEDGAEPLYEERVGMSDEAMVGGPDRDSAAHNAEIRRATKRSAVTTEQLLLSLKASPPMEVLANPSLPAMERRAIAATRNAAASAVPTVQVAAEAAVGTHAINTAAPSAWMARFALALASSRPVRKTQADTSHPVNQTAAPSLSTPTAKAST